MSEPRYLHDYPDCRFWGQAGDRDIWIYDGDFDGPSLIARYGDEGWAYGSCSVSVFKTMLVGKINVDGVSLPFAEWMLTEEAPGHYRAWAKILEQMQ